MIGPLANTRIWVAAGFTDMRCGFDGLAAKVQGAPAAGSSDRDGFLGEVEGLRVELAKADAFHPGNAVARAHAAIRERLPFLARDRALDGEVATAVRLVKEGVVLAAARG